MPEPIPQASAIPYRRKGETVEFCMISSMSGRRWGFPKGIIEPGDTPEETALVEAREEAGLCGQIMGDPLGTYRYQKWGTHLDVMVYLMEVAQVEATWQEAELRERIWLPADDVKTRIDRVEIAAIFQLAVERLRGT